MPPLAVAAVVVGAGVAGTIIGGRQQKKAAEKAQAEARRQEEAATARAEETTARIEEATIAPNIEELERRAGVPGEELLKEVGPQTARLLKEIEERGGLTGEELFRREGEIPSELQERVLEGARVPGGTFEDTLKQQLELSRLEVNKEAARRGVFGGLPEGGIRFEQLGRAGVDLAIKSARERETARQQDLINASALATQFLELSAKARGETADVGEAGRMEAERARDELERAFGRKAEGVIRGQELDIARTEPAAERRTGIAQDIYGIEAGQGARLQEAGLGLIGQGAGSLISGGITQPTTTGKTGAGLEFAARDVSLGGITGAEIPERTGRGFIEDPTGIGRRRELPAKLFP